MSREEPNACMRVFRPVGRKALFPLAIGIALILTFAPPALALEAHAFTLRIGDEVNATKVQERQEGKSVTEGEENICTAASGDECQAGEEGSGSSEFSYPSGIAVNDATKDIYVSDTENHRVDEISSDGTFIAAWGWGVANGANEYQICTSACRAGLAGSGEGEINEPYSIAVDNSTGPRSGDVYVADSADQRVEVFSATGAPLGELNGSTAPSSFVCPRGVAVSPVTGAVYVADECGRYVIAFEYSPVGARYSYIPNSFLGAEVGAPIDVAVDSSGDVDVVDAEGGAVLRFTESGGPASVVVPSGVEEDAVNMAGNIYVSTGSPGPIGVYEQSGTVLTEFGGDELTEPGPKALAVNDETEEVVAAEQSGHDVDFFTAEPFPGADTGPASNVKETSATLTGTVEPGSETATYYFEYGTSESYGQVAPPGPANVSAGPRMVPLTEAIENLQPGTTYFYRLVVVNSSNTSYGAPQRFKTLSQPAAIIVGAPSDITKTSALLTGEINPEGSQTTYSFTYAKCRALVLWTLGLCPAVIVPGSSGNAGSGTALVSVSVPLSGLEPNTTYGYDVTATNGGGTVSSTPQFFTTEPLAPVVETLGVGEVTEAGAMVHAAVNPSGSDTTYHFEYGATASYGEESPDADAGSAIEYGDVSTGLTGLEPNTTYHYRIVATNNKTGTPQTTYGEDHTFTTIVDEVYPLTPTAVTGAVGNTEGTSAIVTGMVGPDGSDTTYRFEYGTTAYYGAVAPLTGGSVASGVGRQTVSEVLIGLRPGATYHYRLVASNAGGTSYGEDKAFTMPLALTASAVTAQMTTLAKASPSATPPRTKAKPLTRAQKLAKALKACKKKPKKRWVACEKRAHEKYATKSKSKAKRKRTTIEIGEHGKAGR